MLRCATRPRIALIGAFGLIASILALALVLARPASARPAGTITVTNTLDDGLPGSLRRAVGQANLAPGFDTINVTANGTVSLVSGQIVISSGLYLSGPGAAHFTVNATRASRIFSITQASGGVTISGITLINGLATGNGGAIESDASVADIAFSRDVAATGGGSTSRTSPSPGRRASSSAPTA